MPAHHAVLYCARSIADVPALAALDPRSPDVRVVRESPLSIKTVRELIEEAYRRPLQEASRLFVLETGAIAPEAQQALLKILEEPPATTRFALVMPHAKGLLPTVLSRLSHEAGDATPLPTAMEFTAFVASSYGERIAEIAKRTKAKDQEWMEAVFAGCAEVAAQPETTDQFKRAVLLVLTYKDQRGSSRKMLLEELALLLPVKGHR